jgi:exodeoxyribonuclease VII small subunit
MDDLTFEKALQELERVVELLEIGELTLEQSLELYEQGQKYAAFCGSQLEMAQLKVEMISADGNTLEVDI